MIGNNVMVQRHSFSRYHQMVMMGLHHYQFVEIQIHRQIVIEHQIMIILKRLIVDGVQMRYELLLFVYYIIFIGWNITYSFA